MKRALILLLAVAVMITAVLPAVVSAMPDNSKTLDKLKLSGVKAYDVKLPTKGVKKSEKQINALLKKIPYKISGKGTTTYEYSLYFGRVATDPIGKYDSVAKEKYWYKYDQKTKFHTSYQETKVLYSANNPDSKGTIHCYLNLEDKTYNYYYGWEKGKPDGWLDKSKKTSGGSNNNNYKPKNYKLYPDATILKQKCMVYSYETGTGKDKATVYAYVSRNTNEWIKHVYVSKDWQSTTITFASSLQNKPASFYKVPKNVNFVENVY